MKFNRTTLPGLWLIELEPKFDERGHFARTYCEDEFSRNGLHTHWPQCNTTLTLKRGAIRGMHYQSVPKPEIKLIRCVAGKIQDVLLDIRRNSATFGKWEAFELSASNGRQLYVPGGFAHGFQCLEDNCEVYYQMSASFVPDLARGIRWDDPYFNLPWPLVPTVIAQKDRSFADFNPASDAQ